MLTSAALLLAVAGATTAQTTGGLNYTTTGPLNVTASQIPLNMRNIWCNSQQVVCRELCGEASMNACNSTDLSYDCKCANGPTPNVSAYAGSLPMYICDQWIYNCVFNHDNDFTGIQACRSVKCGMENASALHNSNGGPSSSTSSSSGSSSTASSKTTNAATGSGGSATSTSSKGMAAATVFAQNYGTHILAGGMLAAFGFAL